MRTRTIALLAGLALLAGCAGEVDEAGPGAGGDTDGSAPSQPGDPVTPPGEGEDEADDDAPSDPGGATAADADLTVEVDLEGTGSVTTWTLTCDPPGGDHPDPAGACAAIAEAGGASAFAPVPADQMCTQIYGGPQVARVTGTLDGALVSAELSRENGCEMARWDALAPLVGEVEGAGTVTQ